MLTASMFFRWFILVIAVVDGLSLRRRIVKTLDNESTDTESRRVTIIRHEHSVWNKLQKGKLNDKAGVLLSEAKSLILKGKSTIVDAPLSKEGMASAIAKRDIAQALLEESRRRTNKVVFAVSNLRRAIQTAGAGRGSPRPGKVEFTDVPRLVCSAGDDKCPRRTG